MVARTAELTGLEFDTEYIQEHFWPCAACSLFRSYRGWVLDRIRPYTRPISAGIQAAQELINPGAGAESIINPKVHWSVRDRLDKLGLVDETKYRRYSPKNLPKDIAIAEPSDFEHRLVRLCRANNARGKTGHCALYRDLIKREQGWRGRRIRQLREEWKDVLARE